MGLLWANRAVGFVVDFMRALGGGVGVGVGLGVGLGLGVRVTLTLTLTLTQAWPARWSLGQG